MQLTAAIVMSVSSLLPVFCGAARAETEEFIEYDLDDEDEEWLESFNGHRNSLPAEKYASNRISCFLGPIPPWPPQSIFILMPVPVLACRFRLLSFGHMAFAEGLMSVLCSTAHSPLYPGLS